MTTIEYSKNDDGDEDVEIYVKNFNKKNVKDIDKIASEDVDVAQTALGDIGIWQIWHCVYLSLIKFPVVWAQFGLVFLAAQTDYNCVENYKIQSNKCTTDTGQHCVNWVYNHKVFNETVISQWNLVCEKEQYVNIGQAIIIFGFVLGNIFCSTIADKLGRKKPLIVMGIVQLISGLIAAYSESYVTFVFMRFIQAIAAGGSMTIGYVLMMELLGGKWRSIMTTLTYIPFNIAHFLMALIAYCTRHWRLFQIATTIPSAIFILYIWIIPESPRWLIAVGREEEALKILEIAAKINENPLPHCITKDAKRKAENDKRHSPGLADLFRSSFLLKNTIFLCFNWFASGVLFFGLEQYVSLLGGDIFINFSISASLFIPGMFLSVWICEKFGRCHALIVGQFLSGISCLVLVYFLDDLKSISWICVIIITIGVFASGIVFPTIYLYSGELFPTMIRNMGVGICVAFGRFGIMIAPFINYLNHFESYLPPMVIGVMAIIASFLCLLLPETKSRELPVTLETQQSHKSRKISLSTIRIHSISSGIVNTTSNRKQT